MKYFARTLRRFALPLVGLLASPVALLAQAPVRSAINGTVLSARTGEPIEDARVRMIGISRSTLTDGKGQFRLTDIPD
jgi:hypothetical protein